jgi:hypothetical protein
MDAVSRPVMEAIMPRRNTDPMFNFAHFHKEN